MSRKKKKYKPRPTTIPKIFYQERDFGEIDKFVRSLEAGEVTEHEGSIVLVTVAREMYRVIPAMRGWADFFREVATMQGVTDYDDTPMQTVMGMLENNIPMSRKMIDEFKVVVERQRAMYMKTPNGLINKVAYRELGVEV